MTVKEGRRRYNILLIEDEDAFRSIVKHVLESEGYLIVEATDALEGINILSQGGIDLIITDIVMPNGEGFELLKKVLENYNNIPVICMTGHSLYLKMFMQLGGGSGLLKPFQHSKLINTVKEQLKDID